MKFKKICALLMVIVTLVCFIPFSAFAASANPMEYTNVLNDLRTMGVKTANYPKDEGADYYSVVTFLEYGYSELGDQRYYGLYLYLYNPSGKPINVDSAKLQLAYVPKGNSNGKYGSYSKYSLDCMSVSTESGYEHLFYKFKLSVSSHIARNLNTGLRQYRLSGVEFKNTDGNYVDYPLNYSIDYSGYQEGFSKIDGAASTLYANVDSFETIQTKLHAASWFSKTSDLGEDYRYEVSSIYFYIPDYYINEYGDPTATPDKGGTSGLYSVRGTYDKYVTNGLVVPDQATYDWFSPIVGMDISKLSSYENGSMGLNGGFFYTADLFDSIGEASNKYSFNIENSLYKFEKNLTQLSLLMIDADLNVSQNELEPIYQQYKNDPFKLHNFSSTEKLYNSSGIFEGLAINKDYYINVDQGSLNNAIKSYASVNEGRWLHKLFNKELYVDEAGYPEIKPIVELNPSDFTKYTDEAIAEHYFVTVEDAKDMDQFVSDYKNGNHLYLMRLGVNPYYACDVRLTDDLVDVFYSEKTGLYFEKVVYENVDVLEFTFRNKYGDEKTVPVNCDPIDIVGSVVRPGEADPNNPTKADVPDGDFDWTDLELWIKLLLVVALIFAVIFVLRLVGVSIGALFKGLGKLITAPFRLIGKALDKSKKKKPKKDKPEKKSKKDKPKEKKSDVAKPKKVYIAPEATPYVENPDEKKPYKRPRATLLRPKKK